MTQFMGMTYMHKFYRDFSFIIIYFLAVALGVCTISFTVGDNTHIIKYSTLDMIENDLGKLEHIQKFNSCRDFKITEVINIIDKHNANMSQNLKYSIANEIYQMDLKYENLNIDLICATITHESANTWNPKVVSKKGAMGLMQIIPKTGKFLSELENIPWTNSKDILFNPIINIRFGCRYLSSLVELFGVEGGLAAYNGGEKRAAMWLTSNKADGILWRETQHYVPAVMRLYNKYKN